MVSARSVARVGLAMLRWIWLFFLGLSLLVVIADLVDFYLHRQDAWGLTVCIGFGLLLALMFLLEGLVLALAQLKEADPEIMLALCRRHDIRLRTNFSGFFQYASRAYTQFLHGQQLLSIVIVVLLSIITQSFGFPDPPGAKAEGWFHSLSVYPILASPFFISLLVAALLPCWVSQLLPQLIAERASLQFATLWVSPWIFWIGASLAQIQAGYPSTFMHDGILRAFSRFRRQIRIPAGEAAIFEAVSSNLGFHVARREIIVTLSNDGMIRVADTAEHEYTTTEIRRARHVFFLNEVGTRPVRSEFGCNITGPMDVNIGNPEIRQINVTIEGGAAARIAETLRRLDVLAELSTAIPRPGRGSERLLFQADYNAGAVVTAGADCVLQFDLSEPTRSLSLRVEEAEDLLLEKATITFEPAAIVGVYSENPLFQRTRDLQRSPTGWGIELSYPPVPTRAKLTIAPRLPRAGK